MPPRSELVPGPYKSQPITLLVGPAPIDPARADPAHIEFYVHSDVLNSKTTYWSPQLVDPLSERDKDWCWVSVDKLHLEDDPNTVSLFLEFIYSRPASYTVPALRPRIFTDAKLYCFGAKYRVQDLQEYAIRQIYEYLLGPESKKLLLPERLELIEESYTQTKSEEDKLRRLLAEDFAMRWNDYRGSGWNDGALDSTSKISKILENVPAFARNLLGRTGNSPVARLPAPNGVTA